MRRFALFALLSTLAGTAVALAQGTDPTARPEAPTPAPEAPPPSPDEAARRAQVVARIGPTEVTLGEIEDEINHQSPFMRVRYRDPVALRAFVEERVRFELLAREAEHQHYGDRPEVVEAVRQAAVQQMIRENFDERITEASIPIEEVREFYDTHQDEFSQPELRRASQIVVATRAEAEAILEEARAADARGFRQLVTDHSLDAETRMRGGDLRYFTREGQTPNAADPDVPEAAVTAAFALTGLGDVSDIVEEGSRFAIVKLTGIRPAEHRDLGAAEGTIRMRLWRLHRQTALETFVEQLRERIHTEVFYERSAAIHMDPPERLSDDPATEEESEGDEESSSSLGEALGPDRLPAPTTPAQ
jgi:hypothetical protein